MALSDPVNVRLGAERRKRTLMKLAQQMAARAGGRVQGAGAPFRSAVAGRGPGQATVRLPFALPGNRPRPRGFDPFLSDDQWAPPAPPVLSSGPSSTSGGDTLNAAGYPEYTSYADLGVTPDPTVGPTQPTMISSMDPTQIQGPNNVPQMPMVTQSDVSLDQPFASIAPSPYEMMMAAQMARLAKAGSGGGRMWVM